MVLEIEAATSGHPARRFGTGSPGKNEARRYDTHVIETRPGQFFGQTVLGVGAPADVSEADDENGAGGRQGGQLAERSPTSSGMQKSLTAPDRFAR